MTAAEPAPMTPGTADEHVCCDDDKSASLGSRVRGARWHRAARWARWLAWVSLAWMVVEGAVGLWQGLAAGSIALTGWALGSAVEGMASLIVIWRFTGSRTLSQNAERGAERAVAVSFWLIAPYIAAESLHHLFGERRAGTTAIGIVLTAVAVVVMPLLGYTKLRLARRLGSGATAGEGVQNYLCAAQAAAVLVGLGAVAVWPGGWWLDPVIGLGVAAAAVYEGMRSWRGEQCC